jgi:peptidoglycan lytic transglycosylase
MITTADMRSKSKKSMRAVVLGGLLVGALGLAGCGTAPPASPGPGAGSYKVGKPYQIAGRWYYPAYDPDYAVVGVASWYGAAFHGRKTANGEVFDRHKPSAAHPTLPLPSIVRVTNLANQRQLELRVNDRGPFVGDRIIDLSQAAAHELGFERRGTTQVRVEFVRLADGLEAPPTPAQVVATAKQDGGSPAVQPLAQPAPPPERQVVAVAVEPAALRAAPPAAPYPMAKHCLGFGYIQVGAFVEPDRAVRLARQLDAAIALPVSADPPATDRYARVRLGPIGDQTQADEVLRWLHQSGFGNAFLVRPGVASSVAC